MAMKMRKNIAVPDSGRSLDTAQCFHTWDENADNNSRSQPYIKTTRALPQKLDRYQS